MSEIDMKDRFVWDIPEDSLDVVLVLMPYITPTHPSPALGILKSVLTEEGISSSVVYANILFGRMIGYDCYQLAAYTGTKLRVGDWTFAGIAFPDYHPPVDRYLLQAARLILGENRTEERVKTIAGVFREIRRSAGEFIESLARSIVRKNPKVVGCSSTFEQHVASLALLRKIRELSPEIVTLIGGANCEGIMGAATVREFDWVDIAFSGEADEIFAELCRRLIDRGPDIPGRELPPGAINRELVLSLEADGNQEFPLVLVSEMDRIPIPDYDDYYEVLGDDEFRRRFNPGLMMETARGCWWRTRKGCTFCGLNRSGVIFRSKSPERVLRELEHLSLRYGEKKIGTTDNIIDPDYFKTLFPRLAEMGGPYSLFFESRTGLSREEVRLLAEAGVDWLQIGVESLHDQQLRLMNKGTTTLMNLAVLKFMGEFGIGATWHLLVNLPGEDDRWHLETAAWLPLVFHLQPPKLYLKINFQRFSDYHRHPDHYGIKLRPRTAYQRSYPLSEESLNDLVYFFDSDSPSLTGPGIRAVGRAMRRWKKAHRAQIPPLLAMTDRGDQIEIIDTRRGPVIERSRLTGSAAEIYRVCESPVARKEIVERVNTRGKAGFDAETIEAEVDNLKHRGLSLEVNGQLLSLAIPGRIPEPIPLYSFPGGCAPKANLSNLWD